MAVQNTIDGASSAVTTKLQGTIVALYLDVGEVVRAGTVVGLIESMKMHHELVADVDGVVIAIDAPVGTILMVGDRVLSIGPGDALASTAVKGASLSASETERSVLPPTGLDRPDLAEVIDRHEVGLDAARPDAIAQRRARNRRTARENVANLIDDGTLVEYGPTVIAAQRRRRDEADLIANTPADGMIGGVAEVNAELFGGGKRASKVVVMSYDYTVLAGTQGHQNHKKKDRLFDIARRLNVPIVFFTEGGGGRPGDTDQSGVSGLDCLAFWSFAELSGTVPLVGIASGYCFAGNAAILGCCDVVIATEDSNIGMGGPAMIEGVVSGCSHRPMSARSMFNAPTASSISSSPTRLRRSR